MKNKIHLMFGDTQFPDVDETALDSVLLLAEDIKPDYVWLMGDMLNATTVGKYGYSADYKVSFWDEIRGTREMLKNMVARLRKGNPNIKIAYLEGNHEYRLQKYIDKNADQLAELEDSRGDRILGMEKLLDLSDMGIEWIPYWTDAGIGNEAIVLHGNVARSKAGYTAHAYIDRHGKSTVAGHTHRLAMIFKTQAGEMKWGIETGSLCKRNMVSPYVRANQADWQQGCAVVVESEGKLHPSIHPIIDGEVSFGGKTYKSNVQNEAKENVIFQWV